MSTNTNIVMIDHVNKRKKKLFFLSLFDSFLFDFFFVFVFVFVFVIFKKSFSKIFKNLKTFQKLEEKMKNIRDNRTQMYDHLRDYKEKKFKVFFENL